MRAGRPTKIILFQLNRLFIVLYCAGTTRPATARVITVFGYPGISLRIQHFCIHACVVPKLVKSHTIKFILTCQTIKQMWFMT